MHILPVELLHRIFDYACTDDGSTVKSLMRVSKFIHDASKPYTFQAVAAENNNTVIALAHQLENRPEFSRPVTHLSVRYRRCSHVPSWYQDPDPPSSILAPFKALSNLIPGVERARLRRKRTREFDEDRSLPEFSRLLFRSYAKIHMEVAPTLRSLRIDYSTERIWRSPPIPVIDFAALHTLTLVYHLSNGDASMIGPRYWFPAGAPRLLPSLRFLDLTFIEYDYFYHRPRDLCRTITNFAPFLTHLRLPVLATNDLKQSLTSDIDGLEILDKLPSTIQCVVVQLESSDVEEQPSAACTSLGDDECRVCYGHELRSSVMELEMEDKRVIVQPYEQRELNLEAFLDAHRLKQHRAEERMELPVVCHMFRAYEQLIYGLHQVILTEAN